jgi:endonuclease YncB( thermonuclease family)
MAAASIFSLIATLAVAALVTLAPRRDDGAAARPATADLENARLPVTAPERRLVEGPAPLRPLVPVEILKVIDGDTIEVRARIWLDQWIVTRVRLRDIDAPEVTGRCPAETAMAETARRHLAALAGSGPAYLADLGRDKYGGRVLGRIVSADGQDLAGRMLAAGHVRASSGRRRHPWC